MGLSKKQRQMVWDKSDGHCWYCGYKLPDKGWHADHLEPIIRETEWVKDPGDEINSYSYIATGKSFKPENDHIGNIVPSCAPCNLFKATYDIKWFRQEIEAQSDRLRKSGSAFRIAERFGIVEVNSKKVRFWFEDNLQ